MENTSMEELVSLMFSATRVIREQAAVNGPSPVQFKILSLVLDEGAPTMKEVADSLFITSPSATAAIDRMVKVGQLKRISDEKDRRVVRLAITDKGKKEFEDSRKDMVSRMSKILETLNAKERDEFAEILTKIIRSHKR